MANDLNKGGERLTERIIDEARQEAKAAALTAEVEISKIKELADKEVQRTVEEYRVKGENAARDILERSRTNAQLDARKFALSAKREVLETAFSQAHGKLCALDGAERDTFLKKLAVNNAYGGETLCPAPADMQRIKGMLEDINGTLREAGKAPVNLGDAADIAGGFLLKGNGYEMNCSFEALLSDFRNAEESGVAKLLFG